MPALIAINVAVFLYQLFGGEFMHLTFVPRMLEIDPARGGLTIATSMFLHAGWMHLLGNLLFLHVFGPSVESTLGPRRFVALYALAGIGAALGQALVAPASHIPMLGASGAISGVLAAYVSLFPRRRIDTLVLFFILPIPALFFVVEWFLMNLLRGMGALAGAGAGGVAWWAHIGGFVAGLVLVRVLFPRKAPPPLPPKWEVEVRGPHGERYSSYTYPR